MTDGAIDISLFSMALAFLLMIIPLIVITKLRLHLTRETLIATTRMVLQLTIVAVYLQFLFQYNNPLLNILYVLVIILIASYTILRQSNLRLQPLLTPIFLAMLIPHALVLLYFNYAIVQITNLFDATYIITIGGMLLGNCLSGNIIALNHYYTQIKKTENIYHYTLALGANRHEATLPYLQESLKSSLAPTIATTATIGLVSLPGMMTGQILGGSIPLVAIKYQIVIMVAIFSTRTISSYLAIEFTSHFAFSSYDTLKEDIFKKKPLQPQTKNNTRSSRFKLINKNTKK